MLCGYSVSCTVLYVLDFSNKKNKKILLTNLSLLGIYHIKPNFEHFIKEIKQYGTTLDKIKNKKARKTYEAFCYFKLL